MSRGIMDTQFQSKSFEKILQQGLRTFNQFNPGIVYILRSEFGQYKIGKTTNLNQRLNTFAVKLPFDVYLHKKIFVFDCNWFERFFHVLFADTWIRGEWFQLTEIELGYIKDTENDDITTAPLNCNKFKVLDLAGRVGWIDFPEDLKLNLLNGREQILTSSQIKNQLKGN